MVAHPDVVLADYKEPHKRFLERMIRDFAVHGIVGNYKLGEVRLRSETITQKSGLSENADQLLRVSREDLPAVVSCVDDAMHRVHAFGMALEFLGHIAYAKFNLNSAGQKTGGTLTYLAQLEERRRDTSGLLFVVMADERIRSKVHRLLTEERNTFKTYSTALNEVLTNHVYIWSEVRAECLRKGASPAKRPCEDDDEHSDAGANLTARSNNKKKKQRQTNAALREELRQFKADKARPTVEVQSMKGGGKGAAGHRDRVPEKEWSAFNNLKMKDSRACKWYNLSVGCKVSKCGRKHECAECGGSHRWVDRHFQG